MVLIKKHIDLSKTKNQVLVAEDWGKYQYSVIISDELRFRIEGFIDTYNSGMITGRETMNLILDAIHTEFNSHKN